MENIINIFRNFYYHSSVTFTHKWTIANFSRLYQEDYPWKWEICPDKFSPPNNEQFKFKLYLYPKDKVETSKDYVSIGVGVFEIPGIYEGKIRCRWNVSIVDEKGEKFSTKEMNNWLYRNNGETISDFIKYSELLNFSSKYLPMDQLTLHFEIHLQAYERIFNLITNNEVGISRFDCSTKITKVEHNWTIENFTKLFDETPYFIQSDYFFEPDQPNEQFCLKLYPNGAEADDKNNVDVVVSHNLKQNVTFNGKLSIFDLDGEECQSSKSVGTRNFESNKGMLHSYNRAFLLDYSKGFVHDDKLKIYCELTYMVDSTKGHEMVDFSQPNKSESLFDVTNKTFHYVSHEWTIHKFSFLSLKNLKHDYSVESRIFKPSTDAMYSFKLCLMPNSEKYLSLHVCNLSQVDVTVQNRLSILKENKEDKLTLWGDQVNIPKNEIRKNPRFLPISKVQDPSFIKQYVPDDKLTIIFEIWVIQEKRKTYQPKPTNQIFGGATSVHVSNSIINNHGSLNMNNFTVNSSPNDENN